MSPTGLLHTLGRARWPVYAGGLAGLGLVRWAAPGPVFGPALAGCLLAVMALAYAGERLGESEAVRRPFLLLVGVVGVGGGGALASSGSLAGLAFVAGGLLFVRRALGPDGDGP
jgi:hypothetical protein